jgi:RNA polymerase sigma factor (sigma-70 family)
MTQGRGRIDARGSVTKLIDQLRSEDRAVRDDAARRVWERYVPALLELARHRLDHRLRHREDEEDLVQNVYASFCLRQERGGFELAGRDELWRLLVTITLRKARNAARRNRRQARDYRRERIAQEDGSADSSAEDWALELMDGSEPTPAEAAVLSEELERRLRALDDPVLRRIAVRKLEGYTNKEIARELDNCTERTIERKLERIRARWARWDGTTE